MSHVPNLEVFVTSRESLYEVVMASQADCLKYFKALIHRYHRDTPELPREDMIQACWAFLLEKLSTKDISDDKPQLVKNFVHGCGRYCIQVHQKKVNWGRIYHGEYLRNVPPKQSYEHNHGHSEEVEYLLGWLSPQDRTIIELFVFEKVNTYQIATKLGIKQYNVKRTIEKWREKSRQRLAASAA